MRKQHFYYILRRAAPKNRCIFCLDKYFSCYIVVEMVVTPGVFFKVSTWKLVHQDFYSQFPMSLVRGLQYHSSSDSTFQSPKRCSDTERLEMLIVLYICLSLMSYVSSNMSFGDIETSYRTISPEACIVIYLLANLIFNWIIYLIVSILGSILNP